MVPKVNTSALSHDAQLRHQQLLEAFVAFATASLQGEGGREARAYLQRHYDLQCEVQGGDLPPQRSAIAERWLGGWPDDELPIGVYPTPESVREYLEDVGFTETEIDDSPARFEHQMSGRILLPWRDAAGWIRTLVAIDPSLPVDSLERQRFWRRGSKTDFFGLDRACGAEGGCQDLVLLDDLLDVIALQSEGIWNVASLGGQSRAWTEEHWRRLADLGVRSVTLVETARLSDAVLCEAVAAANRVPNAPTVFIVPETRDGKTRSFALSAGLAGQSLMADLKKSRVHGQQFVAYFMLALHGWSKDGEHAVRSGSGTQVARDWNPLLTDALRYDATASNPRRAEELEKHFWPRLLLESGIPQDQIYHRRRQHYGDGELWRTDPYRIGSFQALAERLTAAVASADLDRCGQLLQEAIGDLGLSAPSSHLQRAVYAPPVEQEPVTPVPPSPTVDSPVSRREIELAAYYLWEQRGRPAGHEHQFWAEAEAELAGRASVHGAPSTHHTPRWFPRETSQTS